MYYGNTESQSHNSETDVKQVIPNSDEESECDRESYIKMIDDSSSLNSMSTAISTNMGDTKEWVQQRKEEYEMMTNMLNLYKNRLSSYDESDKFGMITIGNNNADRHQQRKTHCDNNDISKETIHFKCVLDRDAKIKHNRLKKSPMEHGEQILSKLKPKENSFRKRKYQIQKVQTDFTHPNVSENFIFTQSPDATHIDQYNQKKPTLTFYHKSNILKNENEFRDVDVTTSEAKQTHVRQITNTPITQNHHILNDQCQYEILSKPRSFDISSGVDLVSCGMSIDISSSESEDALGTPTDNLRNNTSESIVMNAKINRPNGNVNNVQPARDIAADNWNTSAYSTLSSDGSMFSGMRTPQNMSRIDLDHQVESFVVRSGKQTKNGGISGCSFHFHTPPINLKDYGETHTLLGRSTNRNKHVASNSHYSEHIVQNNHAVLTSLTDNDINYNPSNYNYDLNDYFLNVTSTSTSCSSGNTAI